MTTALPLVLSETKIKDKPSVTVRDYLRLTQAATLTVRDRVGDIATQDVARDTATLLREARVFHLNPASYFAAYHAADVYTTTTLAGLSWKGVDVKAHLDELNGVERAQERLSIIFKDGLDRGASSSVAKLHTNKHMSAEERQQIEESRILLEAMRDGQLEEPFPSPLPFPTIYIGFGGTVGLSPFQAAVAFQESTVDFDARNGARHMGYTLGYSHSHGPIVLEHMETANDGPVTISRYYSGSWAGLMSLAPWVVNSLVALINENRTIVEEHPITPAIRYEHERVKIDRLIPRPYYTLRLQQNVIDQSIQRSATLGRYMFHYTYRFDVRGHERIRVQRGEGPIDDKTREKLLKRGYMIHEAPLHTAGDTLYRSFDPLWDELMTKLDVRGFVRPRADEWLAVLTTWVQPHQKGPDDAPYIPAVRVAV